MVTLQLFDTLLQKDDEHILHNLVLRNLENREYFDSNAKRKSSLGVKDVNTHGPGNSHTSENSEQTDVSASESTNAKTESHNEAEPQSQNEAEPSLNFEGENSSENVTTTEESEVTRKLKKESESDKMCQSENIESEDKTAGDDQNVKVGGKVLFEKFNKYMVLCLM